MSFDAVLRRIRIAFVMSALAMTVFGIASYVAIDRLVSFAEVVVSSEEKLIVLEQLNTRLTRAQSALSDYVLSGKPTDLDRFEARAAEQKDAVEILGEPPQLPEQERVAQLVSERTRLQYDAAATRTGGNQGGALELMASARFLEVEAEVTELLRAIRGREQQVWWTSHAVPSAAWAKELVVAAIVLLLAMLAWAFWVVRRYENERRRVTALLDESEAMSSALAENIADGFATIGEDLNILKMNGSALQMLGYEEHEVVGRQVAELVAEPDRPAHRQLMLRLLSQPAAFRKTGLEMTALRKDGRGLPVQVSLNDVRVGGRRLVTALIRDMSGIRQATEAAQASEQNLRQITDTLPVIIVELDEEERFRFVNRAATEFLGRQAQETLSHRVVDLLPPELYAAHAPHFQEVLRGSAVRYEVTATHASGETGSYAMHLIPRLAGGSGEQVGFYAFGTDITALKRIDRMKTEFISTVSHELRTPLTSIRGALGLMSGGVAGKLPDAATNLVGIAQSNCDRLIRLINDILDSEKIESGTVPLRPQAVEVAPLVRQALAANEVFAQQHGVELRMQAPSTALTVRADVDRLLQVLTNLLSNAVKFSPADAVVEVRVSGTKDLVRVEVTDHGPGIPLEFQKRIFQKFSQADSSDTRAKGGTGLGLNISRTLVEKMGGQLGFSSTPGAGATFFFELPLQEAPAATAAPSAARPRPPVRTDKPLILHVEGDGDIRAVVSDLVAGCAACVSAGGIQDARALLRECPFDLVLLEPELDDGSGWELMADLEIHAPNTPVVVFSAGHAQPPPVLRVQPVLVKAQTSENGLVQTLQRILDDTRAARAVAPLES
jgi:PAS domain S-box-containing protein